MYHVIIKHQAKVPSHDTFVARRIEGPGLASNHFYQVSRHIKSSNLIDSVA
jgi:hypothetical protein